MLLNVLYCSTKVLASKMDVQQTVLKDALANKDHKDIVFVRRRLKCYGEMGIEFLRNTEFGPLSEVRCYNVYLLCLVYYCVITQHICLGCVQATFACEHFSSRCCNTTIINVDVIHGDCTTYWFGYVLFCVYFKHTTFIYVYYVLQDTTVLV